MYHNRKLQLASDTSRASSLALTLALKLLINGLALPHLHCYVRDALLDPIAPACRLTRSALRQDNGLHVRTKSARSAVAGTARFQMRAGSMRPPAPGTRPEALENGALVCVTLTDEQACLGHLEVVLRVRCYLNLRQESQAAHLAVKRAKAGNCFMHCVLNLTLALHDILTQLCMTS